ncbi:hypothetical protein GCM10010168_65120 [Actinoplanes ianthinogenes]|uniref:Uncharacterized protein n=1 Tax=Actinoplanes ianthinogenes TaxID=122358 RepID=A0ABM7LS83_9ACTN|nr:hypothetical protein Aiant_27670 [Actinoplanes ianthinogenes]GGR37616.1 hypothetical protein GCM10010168_65120 [Actinoplanes ianthinogenes]
MDGHATGGRGTQGCGGSVDTDLKGNGRTAAELPLAGINSEPAHGRVRPCRRVPRESTAIH